MGLRLGKPGGGLVEDKVAVRETGGRQSRADKITVRVLEHA
jgi:hypothetical protein